MEPLNLIQTSHSELCSFEISDETDEEDGGSLKRRALPKSYDLDNGKKHKAKKAKKHKKKEKKEKKHKKHKKRRESDDDEEDDDDVGSSESEVEPPPKTLNAKFTSIMEQTNGKPSLLPDKFKTRRKVEVVPTDPSKLVKMITATFDPNAGPSMEIVSSESESDEYV